MSRVKFYFIFLKKNQEIQPIYSAWSIMNNLDKLRQNKIY